MQIIQGRSGSDGVAITTLRLPVGLRDEMKVQAAKVGRSFNTHLVMILKEAAGREFGDANPAAGNENAAFERGAV